VSEDRQHARELIDSLPEAQLSALVGLLETIVDPVNAAPRNGPVDGLETKPENHSLAAMEDPEDAAAEVREGYAAIKRGEYTDIDGDDALKAYLGTTRDRAKKELASSKREPA
jgi:hypothetical protein